MHCGTDRLQPPSPVLRNARARFVIEQFRDKVDVSQYEQDRREEAKRVEQLMHAMAARTSQPQHRAASLSRRTRTKPI